MALSVQIIWLFILALPVACITWTVTHEEVFKEPREYCRNCINKSKTLLGKKFFYLLTCEYCFSHYISILMIALTGFQLLIEDWRGYIIAGFSLVWIANIYMSLYNLIRTDIKAENIDINIKEGELNKFK